MWFAIGKRAAQCAVLVLSIVWPLVSAASAEQCNKTADKIFADAALSVARIFVISIDPFDPANKVSYGVGTGFLVDENGTMVTNYHVLLNPRYISVSFGGGQSFNARFVAGDPILDIAIMKVDTQPGNLHALPFAGADFPPVGAVLPSDIRSVWEIHQQRHRFIVDGSPVSLMSWDAPFIQTMRSTPAIQAGRSSIIATGCRMNTLGAVAEYWFAFRSIKSAIASCSRGRIVRPWIGISGGVPINSYSIWRDAGERRDRDRTIQAGQCGRPAVCRGSPYARGPVYPRRRHHRK
jgi:S1-C subfamily serine protease